MEFCCSAEKGHIWKQSGVAPQWKRGVEVGSLLLDNDRSNVIIDKVLSFFSVKSQVWSICHKFWYQIIT